MSIVERALQKAQAKAKADAATPPAHEPVIQPTALESAADTFVSPSTPSFGTAPSATAHSRQSTARRLTAFP